MHEVTRKALESKLSDLKGRRDVQADILRSQEQQVATLQQEIRQLDQSIEAIRNDIAAAGKAP